MRNKPHKKTRTGCFECKRRKIKCDEGGISPKGSPGASDKPDCSNCRDRGVECRYPLQSGLSLSPQDRRRLEFQLTHHWCTRTCFSFTAKHVDLLRDHAVVEAQKHPFVMDAIFGLTAAHMASEATGTSTTLLQTALHYHSEAVGALRGALGTCDLEAAFIASLLTMATAVVLPLLHGEKATQCLLHIRQFHKGIWSIIELNREAFRQGPCGGMLGQASVAECTPDQDDVEAMNRLRQLSDEKTHGGEDYAWLVNELELGFSFNHKRAIPWVGNVGSSFIDAVARSEPVALVIFLHWAVLLCRLHQMWWAQYAGRILVKELTEMDGLWQGDLWTDAVTWAKKQAGLSIEPC